MGNLNTITLKDRRILDFRYKKRGWNMEIPPSQNF